MPRRVLAAAACVGAVCAAAASAGGNVEVTMAVQLIDRPGYVPTHFLFGHVGSPAAGEAVTVLAQVCPRTFETSVAGASTGAGGSWGASVPSPGTAVTYRARWEGRFSEPVKVWPPIPLTTERSGTSVVVRLDTSGALQNLSRKPVELQQRDRRTFRWRAYRRVLLKPDTSESSYPFRFAATFTGVPRNLTIRLRVPSRTAAPCFRAHTSGAIRR